MTDKLYNTIRKYIETHYPYDNKIHGFLIFDNTATDKTDGFLEEVILMFLTEKEEIVQIFFDALDVKPDRIIVANDYNQLFFSEASLDDLRDLKEKISVDKYAFASRQQYDMATKYRDLERAVGEVIKQKETDNE